jgi:hypothetical protein
MTVVSGEQWPMWPGQGSWNWKTGQCGQVSLTGLPGWASLDMTERTGLPGHDNRIKRALDKDVWAEQLEQDSRDWTAGTGQTVRTRHLGPNSKDWSDWKSWPIGNLDMTMFGKCIFRENVFGNKNFVNVYAKMFAKTNICFTIFAKMFAIPRFSRKFS